MPSTSFKRSNSIELLEARIVLATHVWVGPSSGGMWSTAANWTNGAPASGESGGTIVEFDGGISSTDNISGLVVDQIHFTATGNTINGVANVALGINGSTLVDNILNDAGNNQVVSSLPITLSGTTVLAVVKAGNLTLDDAIGGNFPLALGTGSALGTLTLSGSAPNTYTGQTTVDEGTLNLAKTGQIAVAGSLTVGDGLGAAGSAVVREIASDQIADSSSVTVSTDGSFVLYGAAGTVVNDTIGALALSTGPTSAASVSTIGVAGTGTLSLTGNITVSVGGTGAVGASITGILDFGSFSPTITVAHGTAASDLIISAQITGTNGYTKTGAGVLEVRNAGPTGKINVLAGTLSLNSNGVDDAIKTAVQIGNAVPGPDTAIVRCAQSAEIASSAMVFIYSDGLLDLNGTGQTTGTLEVASGTATGASVMTGGGTLTVPGIDLFISGAGAVGATISGTLALSGAPVINVADGAASSDLIISAPITSANGYTKTGSGALEVQGAGPAGTVTVAAGALLLNSNGINDAIQGDLIIGSNSGAPDKALVRLLQSAEISTTGTVTVESDGLLDLNTHVQAIGSLVMESGATSGASVTASGVLTVSANLDLVPFGTGAVEAAISGTLFLGTGVVNVMDGAASSDLLITAAIIGANGLTKTGPGTLELSNNPNDNTYTGTTAIDDGVLLLTAPMSTKSTSNTIVVGDGIGAPGSAVLLFGQSSVIPDTASITVRSDGLVDVGAHTDFVGAISSQAHGTFDFQSAFQSTAGLMLAPGSVFECGSTSLLTAVGPVSLGGVLEYAPSQPIPIGQVQKLISNTGSLPVSGTFDGLPEGAIFGTPNGLFQISYHGGDGNDVTLTSVAASSGVTILAGGKSATYTDVDGDLVTVSVSKGTLAAGDFTFGGLGDGVPTGLQLQQLDLNGPAFVGAKVTFIAKPTKAGGDGHVNVGLISATSDLAAVAVPGDLGAITAGDADPKVPGIGALTVDSMGDFGPLTLPGGTLTSVIQGIGKLTVKGDVRGAALDLGAAGKIVIGGSLTGFAAASPGLLMLKSAASIAIGGDLRASADGTALIECAGAVNQLKIGGSVDGGNFANAGAIQIGGNLNSITIGQDLLGAASVVVSGELGTMSIKGQVLGNPGAGMAQISAFGAATAPAKGSDTAIKSLTVGGGVENLAVFAGYANGVAANADATIGKVQIGGDFVASDIIAGVTAGNDQTFGTADDAKPVVMRDAANRFSTIASLVIKGQAFGTTNPGDAFGIVAEQITAATIDGVKLKLTPGAQDSQDVFALGFASSGPGGAPSDLYLREATL